MSNVYFISRHQGAVEWIKDQSISVTEFTSHLSCDRKLNQGDIVIGTLPINIIANLNASGVRYIHLDLKLTPEMRGRELTKDEMITAQASLQEYSVITV